MRADRIEPRHTFSIQLPTSLYQKIVDKAGEERLVFLLSKYWKKN